MSSFKHGDPVWATMKGYKPWPACVWTHPEGDQKHKSQWVYFFGSEDFGWVSMNKIQPYVEYKKKYRNIQKTIPFRLGIQAIEDYIGEIKKDPSYKLEVPQICENKLGNPIQLAPKLTYSKKRLKPENIVGESDLSHTGASIKRLKLPTRGYDSEASIEIESPIINLNLVSKNLAPKNVIPSDLKYGFIGAGLMAIGMIKNLIDSDHKVNLWNRTLRKCEIIKNLAEERNKTEGIEVYPSLIEVVRNSDVIFCCISDGDAVNEIFTREDGILCDTDLQGKGYVEMSSLSLKESDKFRKKIADAGGRYLDVRLQGSSRLANDSMLVVLVSGDFFLYEDCKTCFNAIAKDHIYFENAGDAIKMNYVVNLTRYSLTMGLTEAASFAQKGDISASLQDKCGTKLSSLDCHHASRFFEKIGNWNFHEPDLSIKYMIKDLRHCLEWANDELVSLPWTAAMHERVKQFSRRGYDYFDSSCMYLELMKF